MSADVTYLHAATLSSALPDDVLIYAARMFLPDADGLNLNRMCEQAIHELRDFDYFVKCRGMTIERAKWQATDPVCIADYVMMFVSPQLAGMEKHHAWHSRLRRLKEERIVRFEASSEQ